MESATVGDCPARRDENQGDSHARDIALRRRAERRLYSRLICEGLCTRHARRRCRCRGSHSASTVAPLVDALLLVRQRPRLRARKRCRKVDGLMCARCCQFIPCSGRAKFCLSQATTFAICCPGTQRSRGAEVAGGADESAVGRYFPLDERRASRGANPGSFKRLTSRVRASSSRRPGLRTRSIVEPSSPRDRGCVHLRAIWRDRADIERQHQTEERFAGARSRDMRHERKIDGREHGRPGAESFDSFADQDLPVALRNHSEAEVVDCSGRAGLVWARWCSFSAGMAASEPRLVCGTLARWREPVALSSDRPPKVAAAVFRGICVGVGFVTRCDSESTSSPLPLILLFGS